MRRGSISRVNRVEAGCTGDQQARALIEAL